MGRRPCCSKEGLNRGAWTGLEDNILTTYITAHGEGNWRNLPKRAGLKRCGKSCRLRWLNYLRPDIKRGNISHDEEELIIRLHKLLGNRWSLIAGRLPGRTDNEIKNYWNTSLAKRAKLANEPETTNPSTSSSQAPQLIRTKAIRCTQVLVPPPPPSLEIQNGGQLENTTTTSLLMEDHHPQRYDEDYLNVEDWGNIDLDFLKFDQFRASGGEPTYDHGNNKDLSSIVGGPDENLFVKDYDHAYLELESLGLLFDSEES